MNCHDLCCSGKTNKKRKRMGKRKLNLLVSTDVSSNTLSLSNVDQLFSIRGVFFFTTVVWVSINEQLLVFRFGTFKDRHFYVGVGVSQWVSGQNCRLTGKSPWVWFPCGTVLSVWVCVLFYCLCGFSLCSPVSSHSPKWDDLEIGLALNLNVSKV